MPFFRCVAVFGRPKTHGHSSESSLSNAAGHCTPDPPLLDRFPRASLAGERLCQLKVFLPIKLIGAELPSADVSRIAKHGNQRVDLCIQAYSIHANMYRQPLICHVFASSPESVGDKIKRVGFRTHGRAKRILCFEWPRSNAIDRLYLRTPGLAEVRLARE